MQNRTLIKQITGTIALSIAATFPVAAADITLKINKVYDKGGEIRIAVYESEQSFDKKPVRSIAVPAVQGEMLIPITGLPAGQYGIMLFHDTNGNEEFDTNLLGIPKEYWSASLEGSTVIGRPGWSDVVFDLPEDGKTVAVNF